MRKKDIPHEVMVYLLEMKNYKYSCYNKLEENILIVSRDTNDAYNRGRKIRELMFDDYNNHIIVKGFPFNSKIKNMVSVNGCNDDVLSGYYQNIGRSMDLYGGY